MATVADSAAHIFLAERNFYELLGKGAIDRQPAGKYDLDLVREQYIENLREVAAGRSSEEGGLDLTAERARLAKEQADGQEMKNATMRGELLPRSDVTAAVTASFARVRARLLALPTKLAPQLLGMTRLAAVKDKITDAVHEALAELAATAVIAAAAGDGEPEDD